MKKAFLISLILVPIIILIFCNFFNEESISTNNVLQPIKSIALSVPEPSGLYFDKSNSTFWTVSDEDSKIYNLDSLGNILAKLSVNGNDLEGIEIINDSTIVTILERDRTILFLDLDGNELNRINLNLEGEPNKGIEGITYNSSKKLLYVINEKNPGILLTLDSTGTEINRKELNFTSDYSGLDYVEETNMLWIISDEEKAILECTPEGKLINKYTVDIEQIEGIAMDHKNKLLYIISDPLEKMFTYRLP